MNLSGHKKRIIVAIIALPLLLLIIIKLPPYFYLALLCLVGAIAMWEFLKMYRASKLLTATGIFFSVIVFILNCFLWEFALYYYSACFVSIALLRLFLKTQPEGALFDIAPLTVGILYIPTLLVFHWFLRQQGWEIIIYLYSVVWAADSFAYYIGKGFGRKKLYPQVSPKKTWEGACGSVGGGALSSVFVGYVLLEKSLFYLIFMGILIGIISIFGDLVESMFKRDAGVKDSSFLFPEHGGVLDKIDAMLYAGLFLYFADKFI